MKKRLRKKIPYLWMSFTDDPPVGFLGVVVIRARDVIEGARMAHALGINPGGQIAAFVAPENWEPPEGSTNRLLSLTEIQAYFPGEVLDKYGKLVS